QRLAIFTLKSGADLWPARGQVGSLFHFALRSRSVQRAEDGFDRRQFDIGVHASSPPGAAVAVFHLDIGNGRGLFTGTQGVFAVLSDLEARHSCGSKAVNQRGQRTVAFTGEFDRLVVPQQARAAANNAVAAFGLESQELPRRGALNVFAPEHRLQLGAAHLASEAVHLV